MVKVISGDTVAEAVRVSHCSHPYPETHKCVGTCTITPKGISLACELCGDNYIGLEQSRGYFELRRILSRVGVKIEYLDEDIVKLMLDDISRVQL